MLGIEPLAVAKRAKKRAGCPRTADKMSALLILARCRRSGPGKFAIALVAVKPLKWNRTRLAFLLAISIDRFSCYLSSRTVRVKRMPELIRSIVSRMRTYVKERRQSPRLRVRLVFTVAVCRSSSVNRSQQHRERTLKGHTRDLS